MFLWNPSDLKTHIAEVGQCYRNRFFERYIGHWKKMVYDKTKEMKKKRSPVSPTDFEFHNEVTDFMFHNEFALIEDYQYNIKWNF